MRTCKKKNHGANYGEYINMFVHDLNPVLANLGPLEIRYYGLAYVLGFLFIYFMLIYLSKNKKLMLSKDEISDFMSYMIIGVIASARLFYVLAYNLNYYISNPIKVFAIWEGGLSFHGGLIGAVIVGLWYCRKKKINFYDIADYFVIPLGIALFLGRIGNFINGELYGRVTNLPWGVKFQSAEGFRHPSQLYEAGKNLLIFIVQFSMKDKELPKGFRFWLFIVMYSSMRFVIEFFREPDVQIGFVYGLTLGQWINIVMFGIGLMFFVRVNRKKFELL